MFLIPELPLSWKLQETPGNFRSSWKLLKSLRFRKKITNSPGSFLEVSDFYVSKICFEKFYCRCNVVCFFECVCITRTSPTIDSTNIPLLILVKAWEISKRKCKVTFVDKCLEADGLKRWLRKSKRCMFMKTLDNSNIGETALTSHMKGKKHCEQALSVSGSQSSYSSESESTDLSAPSEGSNNHLS